MVCPAKYCFKLPNEDPDKLKYAAAEPLACAVRGIYEKLIVKAGDVAVVSGPGAMGLFVTQCLKARGAHVVVSGLPSDRPRLEKAISIGADKYVESVDELEEYLSTIAPLGADITVDCAGVAPSVDTCLKVTKTHGQFLIMGVFGKPITIDINKVFMKELKVTASNSSTVSSWHITMDLLSKGIVDIRAIIDLELPIEEWEKGFDSVVEKSALKVLLVP